MSAATVLIVTHEAYLDHDAGRGHPERPARLGAVLRGIHDAGVDDALAYVAPRPAKPDELARVHRVTYLEAMEEFCRQGGGAIDPDTTVGPASWAAATLAAGAGLEAMERLGRGEADAAFCAVRPPGHHATPGRAMGFCILNNAAIVAAALAESGERVLIVDWDAHHGNGTQEAFYADPRVLYVSMHEYPQYPGTGRATERGEAAGTGTTVNLPLPSGATGDVYLAAVDEVLLPAVEGFEPTWLVVSAGFDAHRADPLTDLGLTAGDFADLADRIFPLVPAGHRIALLEGGYDLDALARSAGACVASMTGGRYRPEATTSGGPGRTVVDAVRRLREPSER